MNPQEPCAGKPERRSVERRIAIHAGAVLLTLVWWAVVFVIVLLVTAYMSEGKRWDAPCGELTPSELRKYHLAAGVSASLGALAPAAVGALLRRLQMIAWPWFSLAGLVTVYAVFVGVHASPSDWCFTF